MQPTAAELQTEIAEIKRLTALDHSSDDIASQLERSKRHIVEVLRVEERGSEAVKAAIRVPTSEGGIIVRVAARLAYLPVEHQDVLLLKVRGLQHEDALRLISDEDEEKGPRRGRRRSEFTRKRGVLQRCAFLAALAVELTKSPDEQEKESGRVMLVMLEYLRGALSQLEALEKLKHWSGSG